MFHLGGAVAEVDECATAYSRRDVAHEVNINAVWLPHEPIGDAETAWAKAFFAGLQPRSAGAYRNSSTATMSLESRTRSAQWRTRGCASSSTGSIPDRVLQSSRVPALFQTDRNRMEIS